MKTKLDLSVIIVSFNTRETTLACLESLYRETKEINFEVIVVDNASTDSSAKALTAIESTHKNFKLIRSRQNLGFGRANNLGAKEAKGEYLLFLNSDTLFIENNLQHCLSEMKKDESIGVYSCNLVNKDGSHQPSGGYFPNLFRLFAWQFFLDDIPPFSKLIHSIHPHASVARPDWVTGAFMMINRKVFYEAGGFDENIFMYTEELELCYRIKKMGKLVVLDTHTSIIHLGGASGGSFLALTAEAKGIVYFWKKHKPLGELPLVKSALFVGSLLRYFIFGIIKANATARASYSEILRFLT